MKIPVPTRIHSAVNSLNMDKESMKTTNWWRILPVCAVVLLAGCRTADSARGVRPARMDPVETQAMWGVFHDLAWSSNILRHQLAIKDFGDKTAVSFFLGSLFAVKQLAQAGKVDLFMESIAPDGREFVSDVVSCAFEIIGRLPEYNRFGTSDTTWRLVETLKNDESFFRSLCAGYDEGCRQDER